MNSVLSIRPWKIGTPISIHREMTSLRCMPASRPSSVGVRWIAMYLSPPRRFAERVMRVSVVSVGATEFPQTAKLDRVRCVDEALLDAESLGEELPEAAHAERLGRVVPGRDEVRSALASVGHHMLRRLAGEEGIEAERDCLAEARGGPAGHDADAVDELRAGRPGEGLLAEDRGAAVAQLVERHALRRAPDEADRATAVLAERLGPLEPERGADQRVVPDLRMCVERQVIAGQRDVVVEQDAEAPLHGRGGGARVEVPEQAVGGAAALRAGNRRPLEQPEVRADAGGEGGDLVGSRNLKPVGAIVLKVPYLEQVVEIRDGFPQLRHLCRKIFR